MVLTLLCVCVCLILCRPMHQFHQRKSLIQGLIERDRVAFTSRDKCYYKAGCSVLAYTHELCTGVFFSHSVNTMALVSVVDIQYIFMEGAFSLISEIGSRWPASLHSTLQPQLGINTKESNVQGASRWWVLKRGGEGAKHQLLLELKIKWNSSLTALSVYILPLVKSARTKLWWKGKMDMLLSLQQHLSSL